MLFSHHHTAVFCKICPHFIPFFEPLTPIHPTFSVFSAPFYSPITPYYICKSETRMQERSRRSNVAQKFPMLENHISKHWKSHFHRLEILAFHNKQICVYAQSACSDGPSLLFSHLFPFSFQ